MPLVTVVICSYNGERYISETMDSVLTQTYVNMEVVVVDDGSSDKTVSIIEKYMEFDTRIRLFIRENRGLAASRNFAFQQARGEWVATIDQDDFCYPERLSKQIELADRFPTASLIFSDTSIIDERGRYLSSRFSSYDLPESFIKKGVAGEFLITKGCFIGSAYLIKLTTINQIGKLDELLRYACDYEYFIRVGLVCDFAFTRDELVAWRSHPNQESVTNYNRFVEYRSTLLRNFWLDGLLFSTRFTIIIKLVRSFGSEAYRKIWHWSKF